MKKLVISSLVLLTACSSGTDTDDLQSFVSETLNTQRGRIQPLPEFQPYSAYVYSASALRSPFESPVVFEEMASQMDNAVDAPDESRRKEPLERYTLGELTLVGTLSKSESGALKALIKTFSGSVHTVEEGNYMGKNHGRIINISESKVDLIEVVPNGSGGWISRPHSMGLQASARSGN
ncbi:pilus assembly protein PilP [Bermanella marisrubri]|uniref:Type 4 fimbrial biogenesis protein PilP n=1 Tax=Bermanella marisrubri TaxID=207949 RepID=Q1N2I3_9GAMM|nr:pilus assembly protein PilP [Bermanella marisrubri]EAT12424.1 type 4 fimbrial biogenesis protein PilP [Oceanobacter sp. RED65] [Bermanella marisrubri]QIZ85505.1 pilus assembly protein PilP [Bermanella marisrubri]